MSMRFHRALAAAAVVVLGVGVARTAGAHCDTVDGAEQLGRRGGFLVDQALDGRPVFWDGGSA